MHCRCSDADCTDSVTNTPSRRSKEKELSNWKEFVSKISFRSHKSLTVNLSKHVEGHSNPVPEATSRYAAVPFDNFSSILLSLTVLAPLKIITLRLRSTRILAGECPATPIAHHDTRQVFRR
jgi:hypothetical protein